MRQQHQPSTAAVRGRALWRGLLSVVFVTAALAPLSALVGATWWATPDPPVTSSPHVEPAASGDSAPFSVTLYSGADCTGSSLSASARANESRCERCFDVCGKRFADGTDAHGGGGSRVRSIRVAGAGWSAAVYRSCHGTYHYDGKDLLLDAVHTELTGCGAVADGASLDHVTFHPPGSAVPKVLGSDEPRPPKLTRGRPVTTADDAYPMFDTSRTAAERDAAMDGEIARMAAEERGFDPGPRILRATLLMARGRWREAEDLLREARSLDPYSWKAKVYSAYALEGQRRNWRDKSTFVSDRVLGVLHDSRSRQADSVGLSDSFWLKSAGVCCKGMPRWVHGHELHCELTMAAVSKILAHFEWELHRGAYDLPQLRTLRLSRGDSKFSPADSPQDTVTRFASSDIVVLRELLPPYVRAVLREYYATAFGYCEQESPGSTRLRCRESPHDIFPAGPDKYVRSMSSDRVGFFVNELYKPLVEAIAGRRLQTTYSYFVRYLGLPGNPGLRPHIDMVDNEYTVSVSIDWTPEERGPVPLMAQVRRVPFEEFGRQIAQPTGEFVTVNLTRGDGVLFRGRQHPHWRRPLPLGHTVSNLLLHYTVAEFPSNMTRAEHNSYVCCRWPPLSAFGNEDCFCADSGLAAAKRRNRTAAEAVRRPEGAPLSYGPDPGRC